MGSIGFPEFIVLFALGGTVIYLIVWVRRVAARGAARLQRQEAKSHAAAPAPARHVERPREEPQASPPDGARAPVYYVEREKIIERQVVVMHCQFCKGLTPVDLSDCKSCGAKLR